MKIRSFSLTNVRSFKRLEIEFSDHLNLLIGSNAQGKTSILEALHFLSLLTSPIANHDRELIHFLALEDELPVARIIASIEKEEKSHRIEIRLILNSIKNGDSRLKKEVLVDGVQRRLYDVVGYFHSVLFLPQMTRIIEDGPDERRKYLDQTVSQGYPGYIKTLSHYLKGITKRNALLKQLFERGGDQSQLLFWDKLISETGARIIQTRLKAISELGAFASSYHAELTNNLEKLRIDYLPSFNPTGGSHLQKHPTDLFDLTANHSLEEIQTTFLETLRSIRKEEIARGVTTIGPHRDDVRFLVNNIDLGVYGSRGQIRTVVMALKFAEKNWLKEKSGELPVILLDETLAELDNQRRSDLLKSLENGGQAVLTTVDLELFDPLFIKRCDSWQVEKGNLTKVVF
ncbi:MAG TPA: DNA replication and repair protein RecF [Pelolinea sp.]|nr:DNA replication and repair protein RecF [Pelolinea sp.]